MKIAALAIALTIIGLTPALGADAKAVWEKDCAKCHGKDGKGDTTMGKKLKVKDYSSKEEQAKFTDEEATKIIAEGKKEGSKTLMKGFASSLSADEIKALVKYTRELAK